MDLLLPVSAQPLLNQTCAIFEQIFACEEKSPLCYSHLTSRFSLFGKNHEIWYSPNMAHKYLRNLIFAKSRAVFIFLFHDKFRIQRNVKCSLQMAMYLFNLAMFLSTGRPFLHCNMCTCKYCLQFSPALTFSSPDPSFPLAGEAWTRGPARAQASLAKGTGGSGDESAAPSEPHSHAFLIAVPFSGDTLYKRAFQWFLSDTWLTAVQFHYCNKRKCFI